MFAELHRKAQQLEVLNKELRGLSTSMIAAQDEERRRIARELHDGLGQDLVAAKMILEGIDRQNTSVAAPMRAVADACAIIDHAAQQVQKHFSSFSDPPMLDEVGLNSALQWYLEGLSKRSGIAISLDLQPATFPRLAREVETAVFRIIQEALTNVFRHSGAHSAWVTVINEGGLVISRVRDDGKGISDRIALLPTRQSRYRHRWYEAASERIRGGVAPGSVIPARVAVLERRLSRLLQRRSARRGNSTSTGSFVGEAALHRLD